MKGPPADYSKDQDFPFIPKLSVLELISLFALPHVFCNSLSPLPALLQTHSPQLLVLRYPPRFGCRSRSFIRKRNFHSRSFSSSAFRHFSINVQHAYTHLAQLKHEVSPPFCLSPPFYRFLSPRTCAHENDQRTLPFSIFLGFLSRSFQYSISNFPHPTQSICRCVRLLFPDVSPISNFRVLFFVLQTYLTKWIYSINILHSMSLVLTFPCSYIFVGVITQCFLPFTFLLFLFFCLTR